MTATFSTTCWALPRSVSTTPTTGSSWAWSLSCVVPITITLHPYLMSISGSGDEERIGQVIGTVVQNLFLVGLLGVGLLFLLHSDLARILLGPEFREGSIVMPPVLAGVFVQHRNLRAQSRSRSSAARASWW